VATIVHLLAEAEEVGGCRRWMLANISGKCSQWQRAFTANSSGYLPRCCTLCKMRLAAQADMTKSQLAVDAKLVVGRNKDRYSKDGNGAMRTWKAGRCSNAPPQRHSAAELRTAMRPRPVASPVKRISCIVGLHRGVHKRDSYLRMRAGGTRGAGRRAGDGSGCKRETVMAWRAAVSDALAAGGLSSKTSAVRHGTALQRGPARVRFCARVLAMAAE
jgi:hypothetical protein